MISTPKPQKSIIKTRNSDEKIEELFIKEEELAEELKILEDLISDLEKRANPPVIESFSTSSRSQSNQAFFIYSNGMKIDHKVRRIYQTISNLRLFIVILNQYHGKHSLAPITINKHQIILNYSPNCLISTRKLSNNLYRLDYKNGDVEHSYANGTTVIQSKSFTFTRYNNKDEQINFPDKCTAYFYFKTRTLEYTERSGTIIRIFSSGREEIHFFKGKKYIFNLNGEFYVLDQDGDERLHRKFKIV